MATRIQHPNSLLDLKHANVEAVDASTAPRHFRVDLELLEYLFDLYAQYTDPLTAGLKKPFAFQTQTLEDSRTRDL